MLPYLMYTCTTYYSLHPKYQLSHNKSSYYTSLGFFGDGRPEALNCNLRSFLSDLVMKCLEVSYYTHIIMLTMSNCQATGTGDGDGDF